jgi:hypothetical protein
MSYNPVTVFDAISAYLLEVRSIIILNVWLLQESVEINFFVITAGPNLPRRTRGGAGDLHSLSHLLQELQARVKA